MKKLLLIYMGLFMLGACRYGTPWLALPRESRCSSVIDSLGQRQVKHGYDFVCLRTGIHIGYFRITYYYDKKGHLIEEERSKDTWQGCCDLPGKWFTRKNYYDTLGYKVKEQYKIVQNGYMSYDVLDTTYYYKHRN